MAERPRHGSGGGTGKPDDQEYGWLYGQKGRQDQQRQPPPPREQGSSVPDPTLMLPQQPRPGAHNAPPPRQPHPFQQPPGGPPPGGPPQGGPRQKKPGRRRGPRFWIRVVLAVLVLWLIYLIAVPMITWTRVDKIAFEPEGKRPEDQPGTTYLMVGSDSRAGLSKEERRKYKTGNVESTLADTIMILHTGSGPDVLLSFPRDWIVDGSKINSYYDPGKPQKLVKALESETGIRIDEYVEIGLGGVVGVVDAVGGIEICPKQKIKDPKAGLNVKKGCQEADGATALGYARTRATQLSDLDRVGRQREVVAAVGEKVLSPWTFINPIRWWRLNNAVPDFFAFGEGTNQFDVARWGLSMSKIGDGRTCTMPVTSPSANDMDEPRARKLFDAIIEDRTDDITKRQCTAAGLP